ncbi:MAG TPA: BMP family ABC transporter substrate-binding protein [Candidatus Limnocylindrales bacterium]|nr:BMP family ABC transporter substrate-binding protein [Candidatus Limnocylindrales bacterium]
MRTPRLAALVASAALIVSACGGGGSTAPSAAAPTGTPAATEQASVTPSVAPISFKACMVTDTAGINDKSFNANAWKGLQDAQAKLGVQIKYLESRSDADYAKNINQFLSEGCNIIVSTGFLLGDATAAAAKANPNTRFAIVDFAYDPPIPNVEGLVYTTNQAAMLVGYAAASWSKTHVMGTFGGKNIGGPVTDFMDGFVAGANYYDNKHSGTKTTVLGWDPVKKTGSFTGNFSSIDDGKTLALGFLDENADVCMGVGGAIGQGCMAAIQERGVTGVGIGVDVDWFVSVPQYDSLILTSVLKKIDVSVEAAIEHAVKGQPAQAVYVSDLSNNGVDIAPFHNYDSQISDATKADIDQMKKDIIAGTLKVSDWFTAH